METEKIGRFRAKTQQIERHLCNRGMYSTSLSSLVDFSKDNAVNAVLFKYQSSTFTHALIARNTLNYCVDNMVIAESKSN